MNKLTLDQRNAIIDWALECGWSEGEDLAHDIHHLTDVQLVKAANKHYSGGVQSLFQDYEV